MPVTAEQLEQINRFARRELKAEEVYSFSVRLCDNEVDRDGERFPRRTLEELADVLEVVRAAALARGWSLEALEAARAKKEAVCGGFRERILLEEADR